MVAVNLSLGLRAVEAEWKLVEAVQALCPDAENIRDIAKPELRLVGGGSYKVHFLMGQEQGGQGRDELCAHGCTVVLGENLSFELNMLLLRTNVRSSFRSSTGGRKGVELESANIRQSVSRASRWEILVYRDSTSNMSRRQLRGRGVSTRM